MEKGWRVSYGEIRHYWLWVYQFAYSHNFRGNNHTHFVTQNDVFGSTHPPHSWKRQVWHNTFAWFCKTPYIGTIGNRTNAKGLPTITFFTKTENIAIKITRSFTWVSHMARQAASLIDGAFEVCSRKFWYACATFDSGQLRNNLKLGQILVRVMGYNICDRT